MYVIKEGQFQGDSQIVLPIDKQLDIATAILAAWIPGPPSGNHENIRAETRVEERGGSSAQVFYCDFFNLGEREVPMATFVVRHHRGPEAVSKAGEERRRAARLLAHPFYGDICCEMLSVPNQDVVVYKHAGRGYVPYIDQLHQTLFGAERASPNEIKNFAKGTARALRDFCNGYDTLEDTRLQGGGAIFHKYRAELPPDIVMDARSGGAVVAIRDTTIAIGPLEGCIEELTLEGLGTRVEDFGTADGASVCIRNVAVRRMDETRYSQPWVLRLVDDLVEMWLLLDPNSVDFVSVAGLQGKIVTLKIDTASVLVEGGLNKLASLGLDGSRAIPVAQCVRTFHAATELKVALRHRDLHARNLLVRGFRPKLIDLGDCDFDLLQSDIARFITSLVHMLGREQHPVSRADMRWLLLGGLGDPPTEPSTTTRDGSDAWDERRCYLAFFKQLFESLNLYELLREDVGAQIAFATQSMVYQRYLMEESYASQGVGHPHTSVLEYLASMALLFGGAARSLAGRASATRGRPESSGVTLDQLWELALTHDGFLSADARVVLQTLRGREGAGFLAHTATLLQAQSVTNDDDGLVFDSRRHVIIGGPTGSGKSTLAEMFLLRTALLGGTRPRALYIAPTKALAQAKYRDLKHRFRGTLVGPDIVLSTGENTSDDGRILNATFKIACMVYEKANSMFSRNRGAIDELGCIVIDEMHMLEDYIRGPLLEIALAKARRERALADETVEGLDDDPLRLVAITTEAARETALVDWLATYDADEEDHVLPHVLHSADRPVPIVHELVLQDRNNPKRADKLPMSKEPLANPRVLSVEEVREVGKSASELLVPTLDVSGDTRGGGDRREAKASVIRSLVEERMSHHCRDGWYRALVFLPYRRDVEELADQFRLLPRFRSGRNAPPKNRLRELSSVLRRIAPHDTEHRVELAAQAGVFIHHSEVPALARQRIETILGSPPEEGVGQVVFATQTLSYGVNLYITDVVLWGADFNTSLRSGGTDTRRLSVCEYHNMLGRAGRFGQRPMKREPSKADYARAFIVVPPDRSAEEDFLRKYYSGSQEPQSALFVRDDSAVVDRGRAKNTRSPDASLIKAEEFSYPFVRSVIDAVRHLTLFSIGAERGASRDQIVRFFDDHSLFCLQRLPRGERMAPAELSKDEMKRQRTEAKFRAAVDAVLLEFSNEALELFKRDTTIGTQPRFKITPMGEAIIDSGTQIETIAPMLLLVDALNSWWADNGHGRPFPPRLHLLTLCALPEVFEPCMGSAPECNRSSKILWSDDVAEDNRREVMERLAAQLHTFDLPHDLQLAESLRECIRAWGPSGRGEWYPTYDGALTDAILRLLTAMLLWTVGGERTAVRASIVESISSRSEEARLIGFLQFANQVSWKAAMLGRVLSTTSSRLGTLRPWEMERGLIELSVSARVGGPPVAALLMDDKDPEGLTREQAASLIRKGITPGALARGEVDQEQAFAISNVSAKQFEPLLRLLRVLCLKSADELRASWTKRDRRSAQLVRDVKTFWSRTVAVLETEVAAFLSDGDDGRVVEGLKDAVAGWPSFPEQESSAVKLVKGLDDSSALQFESHARGATVSLETATGERLHVLIAFVGFRRDGFVLSRGRRCSLDEYLLTLPDMDAFVVALPWLPNAAFGQSFEESAARIGRKSRNLATNMASLSAFCVLSCAVARELLSPARYARTLASRPDIIHSGHSVRGVLFGDESKVEIPAPLRESLLQFHDIGFETLHVAGEE